jgi:hypothetical protein
MKPKEAFDLFNTLRRRAATGEVVRIANSE